MRTPLTYCLFALAGLAFASCGGATAEQAAADTADALEGASTEVDGAIRDAFDTEPIAGANYGAGVRAGADALAYPTLISAMDGRDSMDVVVNGEVVEVCQKKGCWMTLQAPGTAEAGVTVRFKDYGFFMPKSLGGSEVVVEGTARRTVTSVDDLRHYAEDAGKSSAEIAAITEPKEELEIIATGVRVL